MTTRKKRPTRATARQLLEVAESSTGLSRRALGELIECDPSTLTRWANGSRTMPGPVRKLLRLLDAMPEAVGMLTEEVRP